MLLLFSFFVLGFSEGGLPPLRKGFEGSSLPEPLKPEGLKAQAISILGRAFKPRRFFLFPYNTLPPLTHTFLLV